jgi:hypothetical protein
MRMLLRATRDAERRRGAGLQDRFTPEVDPCIGYYTSSHAAKKGRTWCVQDWCAGAGTVPVALE